MRLKTKEVVAVTGVNEKTLHYWDKIGLVRPSIQPGEGRGTVKIYSFADTVAAAAALRLRRAGISGGALRRVVNYVRRRPGLKRLNERAYVVLDGRKVREINCAACDGPLEESIFHYAVALELRAIVRQVQQALAI